MSSPEMSHPDSAPKRVYNAVPKDPRYKYVSLAYVLANYTPGDEWSWEQEEADLHSMECSCTPDCEIPGHYQKMLETHIARTGKIDPGICLGDDGRVWDGHHRIVAAKRLGLSGIWVEDYDED